MTTSDIFAVPRVFRHGDVDYKLRKPTIIEEGMFEQWLVQRAHDSVDRRHHQDDAQKSRAHLAVTNAEAAGVYDYTGEIASEALQSRPGIAALLAIVCRDQGCTDRIAREIVDIQQRERVAEMAALVYTDPLAFRAVLSSLGLPENFVASTQSSASSTPHSTDHSPKLEG